MLPVWSEAMGGGRERMLGVGSVVGGLRRGGKAVNEARTGSHMSTVIVVTLYIRCLDWGSFSGANV
jgi:hypothetical protein